MADKKTTLTRQQVADAGLSDWEYVLGHLEARFETGGFATGLALVDEIGAAAEAANHHPDIVLTYPVVHVRLASHDVGGITSRDIDLARTISELARARGVSPTPEKLSRIEIGLDTLDRQGASRFWAAVLGYNASEYEVTDPDARGVSLWFQDTDSDDEARQRFHLDVTVPPDQAAARIEAALAAGGTLVSNDRAPAFTVLEDPEGNRVCVCTWQGREG
jgi:4a-hydroxytetrahydrobiopterin dehydratase